MRPAAWILGFSLAMSAPLACGKVSNVLESQPVDGGSAAAKDGGGGGRTGGGSAADGGIQPSGSGAGKHSSGAPGGGAGSSSTDSAGGGSSAAAASADAASPFPDPHGPERKALVEKFCSLFDAYPCLQPGTVTVDTRPDQPLDSAQCRRDVGAADYSDVAAQCWDEWVKAITCIAEVPHKCPCIGVDCLVYPPLTDSTPGPTDCTSERQALFACNTPADQVGKVTGSRLTCSWFISTDGTSCTVLCDRNAVDRFKGACTGAPGGPYDCTPTLNDRMLTDDYWNNRGAFIADDCEQAAQIMADGKGGVSYVDCCFTWISSGADSGPMDRCSCTDDPMKASFATCADAAAFGHGKVIDLCPEYVAPPNLSGNFPNGP